MPGCVYAAFRGYETAMGRRRRLPSVLLAVFLAVSVLLAGTGCTDAPSDTPTASDELEQGGTVKPTPAVGGEADEDDGTDPAVRAWCRELSEATTGGEAVLKIYKEGTTLSDPVIADATALLASSDPSDEEIDHAAADVEAGCQAAGVKIGE